VGLSPQFFNVDIFLKKCYNFLRMANNLGFQNFKDILDKKKPAVPAPAYQWQQFALDVINELNIPSMKKNSVFLICKKYPKNYVEKCLNETKELCQTGEKWRYFFKVIEQNKMK